MSAFFSMMFKYIDFFKDTVKDSLHGVILVNNCEKQSNSLTYICKEAFAILIGHI